VLSGILYDRLAEYAEETLGDYQCGFRANRITIDHIFAIRQIQEKAYGYNIHLHNLYIDFKQTFWQRQQGQNVKWPYVIGHTKEVGRTHRCDHAWIQGNHKSWQSVHIIFPITNGVRQGDALSSILFDLVLEAVLQKMNITGHIGTKSTQIFAYAYDVAIVSRNKNALKGTLVNI
jgi:hypothetical protein